MEHVLVGIDGQHDAWEAFARACLLAKRIDAKLHVLLVLSPSGEGLPHGDPEREATVRQRLELLVEAAKSDGIQINYFITEGHYEDEIIRFVNHYRITLLVYQPPDGDIKSAEKGSGSLPAIRHRISCKVELVAPKTKRQERIA
jgi:K+-sensing histidine kinase KdpD